MDPLQRAVVDLYDLLPDDGEGGDDPIPASALPPWQRPNLTLVPEDEPEDEDDEEDWLCC